MATTDIWLPERAHIEIQEIGGTFQNITADVENFSQSGGERELEEVFTFGGATKVKRSRQANMQVELDVVILNGKFDDAFLGTSSESDYLKTITIATQEKYRVTILWTDDTDVWHATQAVPAGAEALRYSYAECYGVNFEPESSADDYLKGTFTWEMNPKDSAGADNVRKWYLEDSSVAGMSQLAAYTTGNKW